MELQYASTVNAAAEQYSISCDGTFLQRYAVGRGVTEIGMDRLLSAAHKRSSSDRQVLIASIIPLFPTSFLESGT